jgi:hypothetical protein
MLAFTSYFSETFSYHSRKRGASMGTTERVNAL